VNGEFNPYHSFIGKWMNLLDRCQSKKDPAWWLYENDARTPLFMLEGIARITYKTTKDKTANKWRKSFKKLEDMLGQIDYYDVMVQQFRKIKSIEKVELDYFKRKREKAIRDMNDDLRENDFYRKFLIRFSKSCNLNFDHKELIIDFEKEIKTELTECYHFFMEFPDGFVNMEKQVHEQRRKLRWVSIYGQCLCGMIKLKWPGKSYTWKKEFATAEELSSPFNKLPQKKKLSHYIILNKTAFLALSHVIKRLGVIKDEGLNIEAMTKAIKKTRGFGHKKAHRLAITQLHAEHDIDPLLSEAWDLLHDFYVRYRIHRSLTAI
jgi:hypothetical protein